MDHTVAILFPALRSPPLRCAPVGVEMHSVRRIALEFQALAIALSVAVLVHSERVLQCDVFKHIAPSLMKDTHKQSYSSACAYKHMDTCLRTWIVLLLDSYSIVFLYKTYDPVIVMCTLLINHSISNLIHQ